MNPAIRRLILVGLGTVAWFALRQFSPEAAGYVLIAVVLLALFTVAPQFNKAVQAL